MIKIACPAFYGSFKYHYPELEVVKDTEIEDCKLIIFPGGADINPAIYGEKNRYSSFNRRRDSVEIRILIKALSLNKKILGVCRGHQLINAYLGGIMVQDMYKDLGFNSHKGIHKLEFLTPGSVIERFFDVTNSIHHQGVIASGKGLTSTSRFGEGKVIESTESENIITVQFHPEFMGKTEAFFDYIREWSES